MARTHGFQVGGDGCDLFTGAAPYYARYRRPYPPEVVSYLVRRFGLDGRGRLLDAGCGTGQVFQVMARHFEEVVGIDADPEMVCWASKSAPENVRVRQMCAEEIDEGLGQFRMAVFGASFHWMDRERVGNLVYERLEPGGSIVVLAPGGIHSGTSAWEAEVRMVIEEWLGTERRAGQGIYRAGERHAQALAKTRFSGIEEKDICVTERLMLDEIVGYLFSTSYASHAVLGEKAEGFERAIRERLLRLAPDGQFEKTVEYTAIHATK